MSRTDRAEGARMDDAGRLSRRQLLLAGGTLAAAAPAASAAEAPSPAAAPLLAPPCGLYCGSCDDLAAGHCHGCGCDCGKCAGGPIARQCELRQCADKRRVEHCGQCREFPCTRLIGFCHDPIWVSHLTVIENLRRRKRIGTKAWVEEQQEYWKDPARRKAMLFLLAECKERARRARG